MDDRFEQCEGRNAQFRSAAYGRSRAHFFGELLVSLFWLWHRNGLLEKHATVLARHDPAFRIHNHYILHGYNRSL